MHTSRDPLKPKPALEKLQAAFAEVKRTTGQDPRGGGWALVGSEPYVRTLLAELPAMLVELVGPIAIGDRDAAELVGGVSGHLCGADLAFRFQGVNVLIRQSARPGLFLLPVDKIPRSERRDRAAAGALRMMAKVGNVVAEPASGLPAIAAEPGKVHIEGAGDEGVDTSRLV